MLTILLKTAIIKIAMANNRTTWLQQLKDRIAELTRWLVPGLGIKRWLVLILLGITLIGVGLGVLILEVYRTAPQTWWLPILSTASLRFLARPVRALIFGGIGLTLITIGILEFNRSLMRPFLRPGKKVVDELRAHRRRSKGPNIVAVGGGHGMSTVLRGLKQYSNKISAIVSVADDGGSSGRLRRETGILPPGDIRNCLVALSDDEALLGALFQYRYPDGESNYNGHSFGNLFISAMADVTGSFEEAVAESGRVLAVHGRVLPSTLSDVQLLADKELPLVGSELRVTGESNIPESAGRVRRVWLEPGNPPAYPMAIQAILSADLIIIGPGSLFTSILPNLLVPDIAEAIRSSRALKVYVCNVATQPGETDGLTCDDHHRIIQDHVGGDLIDISIYNSSYAGDLPEGVGWVYPGEVLESEYAIYQAEVVDPERPYRHDPENLARVIMDLYQERTGPLVE
jgi:uncharacterized cofD-like protein